MRRKWRNTILPLSLGAAMFMQSISGYAAEGGEEIFGSQADATVADWKLGEAFAKKGTSIGEGTLVMEDQSGNGNDLELQFYDGKKVTGEVPQKEILDGSLSFSEETMDGSGGGSMVFHGDTDSGNGADLITVEDAPINQERFEDGYTIEFLYKFPKDWTEADQWMGLMARQTSYTREGDRYTFPINSMEEPQLGSMSVAVSNCKEVQFLAANAADSHEMASAAWSISMDKGDEWYHIAIVSDGDVIRTFVNGCEAFRDYENADMDGLFADEKDGRFRIGSSWYVEKKGEWGYKELDKFLQGSLQEVRISDEALDESEWLISDPASYAGDYGSNEPYELKHSDNYNFVLLPDTQNTVKFKKDVMDTAVKELIDTADELNVKGVIHLGDVVENNNDGAQYDTAREIFYQIPDAGIRFLVQPGNHDGWASGTANYWNSFGENSKLFAGRTSWYLTNHGYSSYMLVDAGTYTYLVISLACTGSDPGQNNNTSWNPEHEQWFREVLETYPNCPTIVTTHDLQNCSDTEPSAIRLSENGEKLWNIVKEYNQVFMLVGGHSHGAGVETLTNDKGNRVISVLTDYQFAYQGGNGLFRYLEFDEQDNKIYYSSYSPYAASLEDGEKTFFDVNFLNGDGNRGSVDLNFSSRFDGMEKEEALKATEGRWMSGEYHTHTGQSKDATEEYMSLERVLGAAFRSKEVLEGNQNGPEKTDNITDGVGFTYLSLADHLRKSYIGVDGKGNGNYDTPFYVAVQAQQREIEKLQAQGQYTDKLIYSATEWDMPGLDHATVGLIDAETGQVPYDAIHEFEWKYASAKDGDDPTSMYTGTGNDYSGDFDEQAVWGERRNQDNPSMDVAVEAVEWVEEHYPDSYVLPNHPSRHNNGDDQPDYGEVTLEALRKLNDAAPNVVFGMEGMPGNQMDPSCELPASDIRAGADEMISVTGGVWDAMLSEGRRFYNFANSDFHFKISSNENYSSGYWASEFSANHTWVEPGEDGEFTFSDVVEGMRSGNSYSVNGNLISDLTFTVSDKNGKATMGEELSTQEGQDVTVTIRFKVPEKNNYESLYGTDTGISVDNTPSVDHVDLIAGHVTGKVDVENYNSTDNTDAKIVKTFTKEELREARGADGYYTLTYTAAADADLYFRVRGTSTEEVDEQGDPVTHERSIPEEKPARFDYINDYNYSHLSFYANPIFVKTIPASAHVHSLVFIPEKAADCIHEGNKAYYQCSVCEKLYEDPAGTEEITQIEKVKTKATGIHTFGEWKVVQAASAVEEGRKERLCQVCGYRETAQIDKAPTSVSPSPVQNPQTGSESVIKAPGKVEKVRVQKASKTSVKIRWKKVKGADGYVVVRASKRKGVYKPVKTVKKGSTVTCKNKKLKKQKTYYYKVRAYKKDGKKKKYGRYSKVVSIKM